MGAQPASRANAASLLIRTGCDQEIRAARPRADHAGLVEQLRRQLACERLDLACKLALLDGQCLDSAGQGAQREQRPAQLSVLTAFGTDDR